MWLPHWTKIFFVNLSFCFFHLRSGAVHGLFSATRVCVTVGSSRVFVALPSLSQNSFTNAALSLANAQQAAAAYFCHMDVFPVPDFFICVPELLAAPNTVIPQLALASTSVAAQSSSV